VSEADRRHYAYIRSHHLECARNTARDASLFVNRAFYHHASAEPLSSFAIEMIDNDIARLEDIITTLKRLKAPQLHLVAKDEAA